MDDGDILDRYAEAPAAAAAAAAAAAGSTTLDPVETYSFNTGDLQKSPCAINQWRSLEGRTNTLFNMSGYCGLVSLLHVLACLGVHDTNLRLIAD